MGAGSREESGRWYALGRGKNLGRQSVEGLAACRRGTHTHMPLRPQSAKSKGRRSAGGGAQHPGPAPERRRLRVCRWAPTAGRAALGRGARRSLVDRGKRVEKLNVWQCLEQAERNAPDGATPCLVFSRTQPHLRGGAVARLLDLYRTRAQGGGSVPPRLARLLRDAA